MILLHGIYNFRPRRVAFRNDWCRRCRARRLAVAVRSVDVLHVFWIPLVPLGAWTRWFCSTCLNPPHAPPGTRRGIKFAGVVVLGLMSATMWAPMPDAEPWLLWTLRLATPLLTVWMLVWAIRHRPEPDFATGLAAVRDYDGTLCPVCGEGEFHHVEGWRCRICAVEHRPLRGTRPAIAASAPQTPR